LIDVRKEEIIDMEERKRWLYSAEANNKLDQIDADWEERHSRPAEPIGFGPEYYRQRIEDANEKPFDVEKMRENMRMADARRARNDLRFGMFLKKEES
jgi:hypothetical protein